MTRCVWLTSGILLLPVCLASACAEPCAIDSDCTAVEACIDAACVPAPPPRVSFLAPLGPVGDTFEAVVEVTFRGGEAVVTLERSLGEPGDPCLPFAPVVRTVPGDLDGRVTQVIVVPGLPALGPSFGLTAVVEVNGGVVSASLPLTGPPVPADVGGITIRTPKATDVDIVGAPLLAIEVEAPGLARAFIEPAGASTAPSTPRRTLLLDGEVQRGALPALRGPQILWVESVDGGGAVQRCGHGLTGQAGVALESELEIMAFSHSADGAPHLVELSTRVTGVSGQAFCDGRVESAVPCRASASAREAADSTDGLLLDVDDSTVEIAVVPRVISGPVEVQVRVSRGERHLGLFGPITIQPALGETWVAGRVVIQESDVSAVVEDSDGPRPGLPW